MSVAKNPRFNYANPHFEFLDTSPKAQYDKGSVILSVAKNPHFKLVDTSPKAQYDKTSQYDKKIA